MSTSLGIGSIGLGNMGARMAQRFLDAGHNLTVFDVNPSLAQVLADAGATVAKSPAEVASRASILFLSLPTPDVVEAVVFGKDGIVEGNAVDIVVDLSTTGPTASARIASALKKCNVDFLDAPVSGGILAAEAGSLTIMISGSQSAFDQVAGLLSAIGKNVVYVGSTVGLGQTVKLLNNMLVASNAVASFEVLAMGVKAGLDPKILLEIINTSSGRSFITTDKIPQCVLPRSFPLRFSTELLFKDVKLGVQEAENLGVPLWVVNAAKDFLAFSMSQGDGPADYASTVRHFEKWAGVEIKA